MDKSGEVGEKIRANIVLVDCGIMDNDYQNNSHKRENCFLFPVIS